MAKIVLLNLCLFLGFAVILYLIIAFIAVLFNSFKTHRPLIVVSLDGFRPDYLSEENTPFLWSIVENSSFGVMIPMFTSETFPNHMSIATGLTEESHGVVSNTMYDPEFGEFFHKANSSPLWWDNGYSKPIWIANQIWNSNGISGVINWPGSMSTYGGEKSFYQRPFHQILNKKDFDQVYETELNTTIEWLTSPTDPANLIMLYLDEPDDTSHSNAPFSENVMRVVRGVDRVVQRLFEKLEDADLKKNTNVIFVSDHGMAEVEHSIDLRKITDTKLYDFANFSTGTASIWPKEGMFDETLQMFRNLEENYNFKVFTKSEISKELHYQDHRRIGPIVLMAEEGWEICTDCWTKEAKSWGNHGYDTRLTSMRAMFIGTGPDFRPAYKATKMFKNVDLYPIMLKLLEIPPHSEYKIDGDSRVTDQFLRLGLRPDNQ